MPAPWTRRGVLRTSVPLALATIAGCSTLLGDGEHDLVVTNTTPTAVTVELTVTFAPDGEVTLDDSVEIPAGERMVYPNALGMEGPYELSARVRRGPPAVYTAGPNDRPLEIRITDTSVRFYPASADTGS